VSNLQELEGETIINDRNCLNCKHLVANDDTDTWLRVGEISYYCNNEHVVINPDDLDDGYLDPDRMEDYAENCMGFEENDELQAIAKSDDGYEKAVQDAQDYYSKEINALHSRIFRLQGGIS
jgi:hypothetical protein